jgi:DNA helicase-4
MQRWTPKLLQRWLFKGRYWTFSSDGEQFELVWDRGTSIVTRMVDGQKKSYWGHDKGEVRLPLMLIHRFDCAQSKSFFQPFACYFEIGAGVGDLSFTGLDEKEARKLQAFIAENGRKSLDLYASRAAHLLNPWKEEVDRQLAEASELTESLVKVLKKSIPACETIELHSWSALFDHSAFREGAAPGGLSLSQTPAKYLDERVGEVVAEHYEARMRRWREDHRTWEQAQGWISRRALMARLQEAPWPSPPDVLKGKPLPAGVSVPDVDQLHESARLHSDAFEDYQLVAKRAFFDRVESNPLTEEQARAVICMDDELLVVAAAGSGKSSTIVAKAGYAIEEGLCEPDEILLLAFNNSAAKELRERIAKRLGYLDGYDRIKAMTFHGFGLEVIGRGTGKTPTAAPWLGDPGGDEAYIGHLVDELCGRDRDFAQRFAMFRLVYFKEVGAWDAVDEPEDYDPDQRRRGFRTLGGETVRSESERILADLLFLHGVNYRYEQPYVVDTRTERRRQYHPDFYYPEIDVWHEHWALDAKGQPPEEFHGYLDSIRWKRELHQKHGTTLFETTTHGVKTNEAQRAVLDMLRSHGLDPVFDPDREIPGREPVSPRAIARLLRVFQQHMKSSQRNLDEIRAVASRRTDMLAPRVELFLSLYEQVAALWEERLAEQGMVDFEDMLNQSAEIIETGRYHCKFKMVLADEFQDTSRARMRLIRAIVKDSGAQLTAVGDDWQSIYRFAGSDIAIMSRFQDIYPDAAIRHLSETFRCPQDLCDLSSDFVSKNPMQIRKGVRAHNSRPGPSVRIISLPDVDSIQVRVEQQLARLGERLEAHGDPSARVSVLLLGRYRKDRPAEYFAWKRRFDRWIDLSFLTVHRAKGLEADIVLLLNVVDGNLGFPSRVEDDPIIQLAMPEPEAFPFGEERRLFYVALTRAKRTVMIYTTQANPSPFVAELERDFGIQVVQAEEARREPCTVCERGYLVERTNRQTQERFQSCSRFPRCDGKRERTWEEAMD